MSISRKEFNNLRTEGPKAIEDLAKLAEELGYNSRIAQLQLNNGSFVSHITDMLEDNPGLIVAIYRWIDEHYSFDNSNSFVEKESSIVDEEDDENVFENDAYA